MEVIDSQCCIYCHLLSVFSSKFKSSMTIILYVMLGCKIYQKMDELYVNWDSNICKLVHKKVSLDKLSRWHKMPCDPKYNI